MLDKGQKRLKEEGYECRERTDLRCLPTKEDEEIQGVAIQKEAVKTSLRDMVFRMVQGLFGFIVSGFRVPVFPAVGYGSSVSFNGKVVVKR